MLTLSTDFIILCVFYFRPQFHLYSVLFVFIWFLKKIPIKPIFIISDYVFAPDFAFVLDMCKCEYTWLSWWQTLMGTLLLAWQPDRPTNLF